MNFKTLLLALFVTLSFAACKDACDDTTCTVNQVAQEDVLTGICLCLCEVGFAGPDCSQTQHEFDVDLIKSYLLDNNIDAIELESGLHYVISETQGGTPGPDITDEVKVSYTGYFLNGNQFESSEDVVFELENLIQGWQEGLQLFAEGDKGTLFIPSGLAYGLNPPIGSVIPVNSVLIFDMELHDY